MSDKYEIYEYEDGFKRVLKNGKAVNEFGLLKDIQKLQAENAELQDKLEDEGFVLVMGRDDVEELGKLRKENAELKKQQLKDGDIAKVVNGVRLAISQVWGNPPQSLREIISKAVVRNLPTPPEGE